MYVSKPEHLTEGRGDYLRMSRKFYVDTSVETSRSKERVRFFQLGRKTRGRQISLEMVS